MSSGCAYRTRAEIDDSSCALTGNVRLLTCIEVRGRPRVQTIRVPSRDVVLVQNLGACNQVLGRHVGTRKRAQERCDGMAPRVGSSFQVERFDCFLGPLLKSEARPLEMTAPQ